MKDDTQVALSNSEALKEMKDSRTIMAASNPNEMPVEGGDPTCNCELQIVDAYVPTPSGGEGGFLGYWFNCDYYSPGQTSYVFAAHATDCIETLLPGTNVGYYQVPTGNNPTYPAPTPIPIVGTTNSYDAFYPFLYEIPVFQQFNIQPGDVIWFDNENCEPHEFTEEGGDGYIKVRLRCSDNSPACDGGHSYYSNISTIPISIDFGGFGLPVPVKLGGSCGCQPRL
ncbi:MAG: hypothetical protein IT258_14215 [Saprospiraceae bacterium]|nr:hypothetical protein [Saprospiraceae bacterium]